MASDPVSVVRDPTLVKNRIFVGNLPTCTREELESICHRYGKVIGSLVQKNFGFVQFESEDIANKAAHALHASIFKGNKITVRNAGTGKGKPKPKPKDTEQTSSVSSPMDNIQTLQQIYYAQLAPDYNDCEIIVVNKAHLKYAEYIEQRLKCLHLKVDLLFPNEDVPIGKVLANISSRGCLYAILVTAQNEEHRSITVNILYGQPAEHRNMPVEDAINLISTDFQVKLSDEKSKMMSNAANSGVNMVGGGTSTGIIPSAVPIIAASSFVAPPLKERHPEAVQTLLSLLADNLPLTVLQYDRIIKYLQERRELQVKAELGEGGSEVAPPPAPTLGALKTSTLLHPSKPSAPPDPEIELQKKILDILNKSSITESKTDLVYPNVASLKNHPETIELLKDVKIQNALDSLMKTNLVESIESYFKF